MGARDAVLKHVRHWNAMEKELWLALFAEDVEYEDPPGTVASRGKRVMSEHAWDGAFAQDKRWILDPVLIIQCGNEAQVHMRNYGAVAGVPSMVESIELWRVNDEGLVVSVRAFWEVPTDPTVRDHLALTGWDGATSLD
jgi:hypothetical protein